jgi:hypothetical protein
MGSMIALRKIAAIPIQFATPRLGSADFGIEDEMESLRRSGAFGSLNRL